MQQLVTERPTRRGAHDSAATPVDPTVSSTDASQLTYRSESALIARAQQYADRAHASATRRAYQSDWADWAAWCAVHGATPLPAASAALALYLTERAATLRTSTLARRLTALQQVHLAYGERLDRHHPALRAVWSGIRRTHGTDPVQQAPLLLGDVRRMSAALPDSLLGCRDRALILLGFAGAFRRSELVALDAEDVRLAGQGLVVQLRRTKTDQEASGRIVAIPYGAAAATCPVRAVLAWQDAAGIRTGALFRPLTADGSLPKRSGTECPRLSDRAVARVVQRTARAAGVQGTFAGHSLRAGLVTSAAAAGVSEHDIMRHTGHRRAETLRKYIRNASAFESNPAGRVGL